MDVDDATRIDAPCCTETCAAKKGRRTFRPAARSFMVAFLRRRG
jgi:hypothetical protein